MTKAQINEFEKVLSSHDSNAQKAQRLLLLAQKNSFESKSILDIIENFDFKDNLKKIDLKLYIFRSLQQFDVAMNLAAEYENLVKNKDNFFEYAIDIALHKIFLYFNNGNKEQSVKVGDEIIEKTKNNTQKEIEQKLIEIYRCTGGIATSSGDYKKCMAYYKEAIRLCEKHDDYISLITTYAALGDIYRSQYEPDKALGYLFLGLQIAKDRKYNKKTANILRNIGLAYSQINQDKEAEKYLKEALVQSELVQDYRSLPQCLMSLGDFYVKIKKLNAFFEIEKKIMKLSLFKEDRGFKGDVFYLSSEAFLQKEEYQKALKKAQAFEQICIEKNGFIDLKKSYELSFKIYKKLENFEKALFYFEKLYALDKKILNEKAKRSLNEFEVKFQNEKKEKEIQALKLESVSFQLQSLRAQMNPHFIFNSIASISSSLEPATIENSKTLLNSFARLMRSNLEFAELEKISLEDEIQFLKDYLTLEKNRLGEKLNFEFKYSNDLDIDFIEIPSMIIQPYIENAIKHGIENSKHNGFIKILFEENDDFLICEIEDNGIGREAAEKIAKKNKKHLGKSTTINAKRLSLIQNKEQDLLLVKYENLLDNLGENKGTKVVLSIKM